MNVHPVSSFCKIEVKNDVLKAGQKLITRTDTLSSLLELRTDYRLFCLKEATFPRTPAILSND